MTQYIWEDFLGGAFRDYISAGQNIVSLYLNENSHQTLTLDTVNHWITSAVTGPADGVSRQSGLYDQYCVDYGVPSNGFGGGTWFLPQSFAYNFLKTAGYAGSSTTSSIRMRVKMRTDVALSVDQFPIPNFEFGNYIKSPLDINGSAFPQGAHYYWQLPLTFIANEWTWTWCNAQMHHWVQQDGVIPYDTEFYFPTRSGPVHIFDGMCEWYINGLRGDIFPITYTTNNIYWEVQDDTTEPFRTVTTIHGSSRYHMASGISLYYDGTLGKYNLRWKAVAANADNYKVYYATSSMKVGGLGIGTWDGTTIVNDGSRDGCQWVSPALSRSSLYFAIQPITNNPSNLFTEVQYAPAESGTIAPNVGQDFRCYPRRVRRAGKLVMPKWLYKRRWFL